MKILGADVDWHTHFANSPRLVIHVDAIPHQDSLYYMKHGNTYLAAKEGYVSFYYEYPNDRTGYGGISFEINLANGGKHTLKGPWSSRAGIINRDFAMQVMDVVLVENADQRFAGHCTLDFAKQAIKRLGKVRLAKFTDKEGEITYEPVKISNMTKFEWVETN